MSADPLGDEEATVTPEEAVLILAEFISNRDDFTEDAVYSEMNRRGVPDDLADRTYKFTQIAWGRSFLSQFGVRFPADYFWLDRDGKVLESGQLSAEPSFAAAASISRRHSKTPAFQRLVGMSADVRAVADLVKRGSNPRKIQMTPAVVFAEPPTTQGMMAVERMTEELLSASRSQRPPRPWWKFW